jgi:hypothetical protein
LNVECIVLTGPHLLQRKTNLPGLSSSCAMPRSCRWFWRDRQPPSPLRLRALDDRSTAPFRMKAGREHVAKEQNWYILPLIGGTICDIQVARVYKSGQPADRLHKAVCLVGNGFVACIGTISLFGLRQQGSCRAEVQRSWS